MEAKGHFWGDEEVLAHSPDRSAEHTFPPIGHTPQHTTIPSEAPIDEEALNTSETLFDDPEEPVIRVTEPVHPLAKSWTFKLFGKT